jgi:hypothetical protein
VGRGALVGGGQQDTYLCEGEPSLLGRADDPEPPNDGVRVAALPAGTLRFGKEPLTLVEADRGHADAGLAGDFADAERCFWHENRDLT